MTFMLFLPFSSERCFRHYAIPGIGHQRLDIKDHWSMFSGKYAEISSSFDIYRSAREIQLFDLAACARTAGNRFEKSKSQAAFGITMNGGLFLEADL